MKKNKKSAGAAIPSAGQRRDATRRDNNAAIPSQDSVKEEMEWRKEHQQ